MELSNLHKVTLEDASTFREHYRRFPPEHSDYLHGTMYTWRDLMTYSFTLIGDHLVVMGEMDGKRFIRPPVGPLDREFFTEVIRISRNEGLDPVLSMIGEDTVRWMRREFPEMSYVPHRDYFEYVYLSRDLAELPGKDHLKVRNYLNNFRKNNEHMVEEISKGNIHEVREFLIEWCEKKGCKDDPLLLHERQANFHALEDLFPLGFNGLLIRVKGEVEAFSIFEEMSSEMAVVHHEKANPDIVGIYQAINNETAKYLMDRYRFINREADMGVEGLRRAKERYRPHHLEEVYHAH